MPEPRLTVLQLLDKRPGAGGVDVHVHRLTRDLEHLGHRVVAARILALRDAAGLRGEHWLPPSYGPLQGLRAAGRFQALLAELKPDVVHLHAGFTTLSPLVLRKLRACVAVVGTLHDVRPFCAAQPTGALPARALRRARMLCVEPWARGEWRRLPFLVVPSDYLRRLALSNGFCRERIRLVPHCVEVPPSPLPPHSGVPRVVYLGRLADEKGVGVLLAALARLRGLRWTATFLGDGPKRAALEQEAERLGLRGRIEFRGHVGPRERDEALAGARMVAMPSLVPEAFGLSGVEALAVGRPVVSFGLGGVREWLRDGETGLVCAPGAGALAAQIERLLLDAELAARLGRRGHELVRCRFSGSAVARQMGEIYRMAAIRLPVGAH